MRPRWFIVLYTLFFMLNLPPAYAGGTLTKVLDFITGSSSATGTDQPFAVMGETAPDRMTENCLHCHDGSITSKVSSHPVGIYYDDYVRQHPNDYRSIAYQGSGIPLVNGKVSCISCHQLKQAPAQFATNGSMLPAGQDVCASTKQLNTGFGNRGLCLACHIK